MFMGSPVCFFCFVLFLFCVFLVSFFVNPILGSCLDSMVNGQSHCEITKHTFTRLFPIIIQKIHSKDERSTTLGNNNVLPAVFSTITLEQKVSSVPVTE